MINGAGGLPLEIDDLIFAIVKSAVLHFFKIALTDFSDGLSFYKKIADVGRNLLNPNGFMILETGGEKQYKFVKDIFLKCGYKVEIHKDKNGDHRFIEVQL